MHRLLAVILVSLASTAPRAAQTATATLSADLGPIAKLSFSSTTLSFTDADPDALAQVPASGGPITITAKARAAQGQVVMTVLANGNPRPASKRSRPTRSRGLVPTGDPAKVWTDARRWNSFGHELPTRTRAGLG